MRWLKPESSIPRTAAKVLNPEAQPDEEQEEDPSHKRAAGNEREESDRAHQLLENAEVLLRVQRAALAAPNGHTDLHACMRASPRKQPVTQQPLRLPQAAVRHQPARGA